MLTQANEQSNALHSGLQRDIQSIKLECTKIMVEKENLKEDCAKLVSAKDELEQNHDTLQFELEAQEKKSGSGIKGLQAALS